MGRSLWEGQFEKGWWGRRTDGPSHYSMTSLKLYESPLNTGWEPPPMLSKV